MKTIELYIHADECADPKLIQISSDETVAQLLRQIKAAEGNGHDIGDLHVFVEDKEEPLAHHCRLSEHGIGHRHHVHCHRCKKVTVVVDYNGKTKEASFPPSTRAKKVLRWAVHAFGLTGPDAADKVLVVTSSDHELSSDEHIGSFVKHPHCRLELGLVTPVRVQG